MTAVVLNYKFGVMCYTAVAAGTVLTFRRAGEVTFFSHQPLNLVRPSMFYHQRHVPNLLLGEFNRTLKWLQHYLNRNFIQSQY
jgi:hypothetical protein